MAAEPAISPGKRLQKILVLCLALLAPVLSNAQEFNYWSQQVGAYSSLLSVVGDLFFLKAQGIRNGAGQDLGLTDAKVDAVSHIFSAIQKINDNISITYGLMNRAYFNTNYKVRHEGWYDVMESSPEMEYYRGSFDYSKRFREDWAGLGIGWRLLPELGFGVSLFACFRSDDYSSSIGSNVFDFDNATEIYSRIAHHSQTEVLRYRNSGALIVAGFAYEKGEFQAGLTITSPLLTAKVFSNGMLDRIVSIDIPTQMNEEVYSAFTAQGATGGHP